MAETDWGAIVSSGLNFIGSITHKSSGETHTVAAPATPPAAPPAPAPVAAAAAVAPAGGFGKIGLIVGAVAVLLLIVFLLRKRG